MTEQRKVCPSGQGEPGATLLGIIGPDGRAIFTPHGPKVTPTLREQLAATTSGPLESRFRFTMPCATSACVFWNGRCRAIDAAHEDFDSHVTVESATLPECGIRESCRWWAQEGPDACRVCPHVRTAAIDPVEKEEVDQEPMRFDGVEGDTLAQRSTRLPGVSDGGGFDILSGEF
jgi:hypothetical protein